MDVLQIFFVISVFVFNLYFSQKMIIYSNLPPQLSFILAIYPNYCDFLFFSIAIMGGRFLYFCTSEMLLSLAIVVQCHTRAAKMKMYFLPHILNVVHILNLYMRAQGAQLWQSKIIVFSVNFHVFYGLLRLPNVVHDFPFWDCQM